MTKKLKIILIKTYMLSMFINFLILSLKGQVHCFSMQVVMNKCFLLNPEKLLVQIRIVVFEKNAPLIPKNDVTEPKAKLL